MRGIARMLGVGCALAALGLSAGAQETPPPEPPQPEESPAPEEEPAPQPPAQEEGEEDEIRVPVDMRVSASGPGAQVTVDRGTSDGLRPGDQVLFRPRQGGTYRGAVRDAGERSSVVELFDPAFVPEPGTRGEALVPASRLARPRPPTDLTGEGGEEDPADPAPQVPEHPPWENQDEEWTPGQPLLARVMAVRPEDRAKIYSGRLYLIGDTTWTTEDDRSDFLLRAGTDLEVENPFGLGGHAHFAGEFDDFTFKSPDLDDDDETVFRVDRLSYAWGGTRFEPNRVEGGRFLQHGMPEFGFLDGVEWTRRRANGHRWGASLGYMPELDIDFSTGDDFQLAAFYEWVVEGRNDLSLAAGLQKTWHNGSPDRDLFVARFDYLPREGWDLRATTWVDFYDSGDDLKDSSVEVTQALVSTGRHWKSGSGVELTYRRLRFPELKREGDFLPPTLSELADNRYDRLAFSGWWKLGEDSRLRGVVGVWDDEDEKGGDVETGIDWTDVWAQGDRADVTVFTTRGAFSVDGGVRLGYGRAVDQGRWDLFYEVADRHQNEFSHESDDLWEHALRGSNTWYLGQGWDVSLDGEVRYIDEEIGLSATLYVQKTF